MMGVVRLGGAEEEEVVMEAAVDVVVEGVEEVLDWAGIGFCGRLFCGVGLWSI